MIVGLSFLMAVLILVVVSSHCRPDVPGWVLRSFTALCPSQIFTLVLLLLTTVVLNVKSLIGVIGIISIASILPTKRIILQGSSKAKLKLHPDDCNCHVEQRLVMVQLLS